MKVDEIFGCGQTSSGKHVFVLPLRPYSSKPQGGTKRVVPGPREGVHGPVSQAQITLTAFQLTTPRP